MLEASYVSLAAVGFRAARAAGDHIITRYRTELVVETKSSLADVVTDVDRACEEAIRRTLSEAFDTHRILGEEGVRPGREAAVEALEGCVDCEDLWIVDPLDGTTNFVHQLPLSVISIAYARAGEVRFGVILDPYRDEWFYALRGEGAYAAGGEDIRAWLESPSARWPGKPIRVSGVRELRRAVMATGLPVRHRHRQQVMHRAADVISEVKSLRTLGAAALHLAYVAAGRIDVFWEFDLNAWDLAAGALLVQEAGGVIQSMRGEPYALGVRDVCAGSDGELLRTLGARLTAD
ncbi:inositol monophosphatase family protein [Alicyclobacillus vulcanalis]|uniref:Inositol-1-monophosphatase n=1 Tax=Alicyclobacillus vulcanalis TaxID=252246 RepID=A0A1N7LYI7_9BACL|nr:inositol monophosphatase family protein [Alicyclobacillus vulcanalis]SIS78908.1 myo-inositol-1(or 4)-monophosphatase [Alicyclobacillus vulcanalis]